MKKGMIRATSKVGQAAVSLQRISLIAAVTVLAACSAGGKPTTGAEPTATQLSALSQIDASAEAPSPPMIASLTLPAWTQCAVYPENGNPNDPSHSGIVSAGSDGKVHFRPPPPDWGTKLTFNCSLSGSAKGTYFVDFSDTSTFTEESPTALTAQPIGTRPALTGDLTALSNSQLLKRGYPPRPDPQADPPQYSRWVDAISRPVTVFQPVPITYIGPRQYGQYIGNTFCNWTGFIQSADGFQSLTNCLLATNWEGATYSIYHFYSSVPYVTSGCGIGSNCATGIWAGIGGLPVAGQGSKASALIQSGFYMQNNGIAGLFVEFAPNSAAGPSGLPLGDDYARGDQFYIWGWSASESNCEWTGSFNNTNFGCFGFQDITKGWTYSSTSMEQPRPSGLFLPTSGELIVENPSGSTNADYTNTPGYGTFYDENESPHPDPGASSATDPYVYQQQNDSSGNAVNVATWANGLQSPPRDPATFIFQEQN
jgi:hypothetical protein